MDDVNATIANATAATSGDDSNGLSFVPGVLATHCDLIPSALLSDATYCSPISMLAFAVLAYVVYINSLVLLEGIRIVKEIIVAKARRVLVAATPSADEATGGPFASDSVMLIVCADGVARFVAGGGKGSWLSLSGMTYATTGLKPLSLGSYWKNYGGSYANAEYSCASSRENARGTSFWPSSMSATRDISLSPCLFREYCSPAAASMHSSTAMASVNMVTGSRRLELFSVWSCAA